VAAQACTRVKHGGQQALKDAGAQNVYLQECMVPHWVRGKKEEARFKSHKRSMDPSFNVLSIGNAVGTGNAGVTAKVIEVRILQNWNNEKTK